MAAFIQNAQSTPPLSTQTSSTSLVGEWKVGEKTICLFRENDRFAFSTTGREGSKSSFKSPLYSVEYAENLVKKFWHTIGNNLERDPPHSSTFLPKLCTQAENAPELEVALFGRVDAVGVVTGTLKGLRWGVVNNATQEKQSFEVADEDSVVKGFITHAPFTNIPIMEPCLDKKGRPILDKKGNPVMQLGSGSYEMSAYAKRFSVTVDRDSANRIQKVVLHHLSLTDGRTYLDEENWAVTLVSGKTCGGEGFFTRLIKGRIGHALLACEGVIEGKSFLDYIHLTKSPRNRLPHLKTTEGQIEKFRLDKPLDTENGPTWRRTKNAVENMFAFVEAKKETPIKFAFYTPLFLGAAAHWMMFKNEFLQGSSSSPELIEMLAAREAQATERSINCLNCMMEVAERAGIIFYGHVNGTTPLRKIEILNSAPYYQIPEEITELPKGSLHDTKSEVVEGMLSSCVILTSKNCPPENFEGWGWHVMMEETAATDREIERLMAATSLGEMWRGRYFPKRWK